MAIPFWVRIYAICFLYHNLYTIDLLYSKVCIYYGLQYAPFDVFVFHFSRNPMCFNKNAYYWNSSTSGVTSTLQLACVYTGTYPGVHCDHHTKQKVRNSAYRLVLTQDFNKSWKKTSKWEKIDFPPYLHIRTLYNTSQLSLGAGHCQWGRLTDRNICN